MKLHSIQDIVNRISFLLNTGYIKGNLLCANFQMLPDILMNGMLDTKCKSLLGEHQWIQDWLRNSRLNGLDDKSRGFQAVNGDREGLQHLFGETVVDHTSTSGSHAKLLGGLGCEIDIQ